MGLFSEIKRRNVHRMAVLYVLAAWLVMQVADVVTGLVALPDWLGAALLALLAIGFPIALAFSWFFEVTPEGLSLEKDVAEGQPVTHATNRRMDFVIIAILSAALILFAYDKWWPRGPMELSVAVLPFENMSEDPKQEYFSDGISEEILNLLAQIQPLKVIARTSSFAFKGKDEGIASIAQQLNVRNILEGSVRRSGNRVRITAQLIDAKDSSHLWSQTFDRDYDAENLFNIQSEIARAITNRLRMTLTGEDEQRLANVPTKNTEAYTAYLIGRQRLTDRKVDELADAVEQFARATELDPLFAAAWSGLADACFIYGEYSGGHSNEHCPASPTEREQFARKALELDPECAEAWITLGAAIRSQADGSPESAPKFQEAKAAYERGLELNPTLSQGYHWYAAILLQYHAYPDRPLGWLEAWRAGAWEKVLDKGLEVDPLSIPLHLMKTFYPIVSKNGDEAIRHARRIIEIAPDSPRGYESSGELAWGFKGRLDESIRWESQALERDPKHPGFPKSIGRAYSALGDPDMALTYFDLARALTAPDNKSAQDNILVEQAVILLVSGKEKTAQIAELQALLSESTSIENLVFGVSADLAKGRPADALARFETAMPKCLAAKSIPDEYVFCPPELVRVYQELGDDIAARNLGDAMVERAKMWVDVWTEETWRLNLAGALAVMGRKDEALDVLEKLFSSGYRGNYDYFLRFDLYHSFAFDAIRGDERFQAIVATIEADMAQQLENVREMQRRGEVPTLKEVKALVVSAQGS